MGVHLQAGEQPVARDKPVALTDIGKKGDKTQNLGKEGRSRTRCKATLSPPVPERMSFPPTQEKPHRMVQGAPTCYVAISSK